MGGPLLDTSYPTVDGPVGRTTLSEAHNTSRVEAGYVNVGTPCTSKVVNVLVADAEARVRSALRLLLERMSQVGEVGEAWDQQSLITGLQRLRPHLVLLDWQLAGTGAARLLYALHEVSPYVRVVVLSVLDQDRQRALAAGADAFASKSDLPDDLICILGSMRSEISMNNKTPGTEEEQTDAGHHQC